MRSKAGWFGLAVVAAAVYSSSGALGQSAGDNSVTWSIPLYRAATDRPAARSASTASTASTASIDRQPTYAIRLYRDVATVPNLKGKTWDEARGMLEASRLTTARENADSHGDDIVDHQRIAAGKQVPPGTEVRLSLTAEVPDVVGMTLGEAYEVLEIQNRFTMKYNPLWAEDYEVSKQKPQGGTRLHRGRDVRVASMVTVPDFRRMSVDEARDALVEGRLLGEIHTFFEDSDRILRQQHRPGKQVPALSKIRLDTGVEVPNLVGLEAVDADALLREVTLNGVPQYRLVPTGSELRHGQTRVDWQSERPGVYLARGSKMRVRITRFIYEQQRLPPIIVFKDGNNNGKTGQEPAPPCILNPPPETIPWLPPDRTRPWTAGPRRGKLGLGGTPSYPDGDDGQAMPGNSIEIGPAP